MYSVFGECRLRLRGSSPRCCCSDRVPLASALIIGERGPAGPAFEVIADWELRALQGGRRDAGHSMTVVVALTRGIETIGELLRAGGEDLIVRQAAPGGRPRPGADVLSAVASSASCFEQGIGQRRRDARHRFIHQCAFFESNAQSVGRINGELAMRLGMLTYSDLHLFDWSADQRGVVVNMALRRSSRWSLYRSTSRRASGRRCRSALAGALQRQRAVASAAS